MTGQTSKQRKKTARKAAQQAIAEAETAANRQVRRQHIWTPGHHPNDPDAEAGSGWEYLKLVPEDSDPRNKTNKHTLGGGPESGIRCPHCGEMTHIVDEYKATDLLELVFRFTPEQRAQIADKTVSIVICPKCEGVMQFRTEILSPIRERWLTQSQKEG